MIARQVCLALALVVSLASTARAQTPPATPPPTPPVPCSQNVPPCGPDSQEQPGVPKGEVIKGEFAASAIYPGTWREYWVYIPAGLDRTAPAPVMIFQDGIQYKAPAVFDKLIARKAIPVMVGVFVMHGRVKARPRRRPRSLQPQLRVRRPRRQLRPVPARGAAAGGGEDARARAVEGSQRPRHRRLQQRRHRRVHRGLGAARRLPPRLQRHRHLRRPPRRQQLRAHVRKPSRSRSASSSRTAATT